ncbi:MAG: hypothetical protein K2J82_09035 [Muribaculaceae bacterium]|nr:hypothetical protein [Muribaculaceae bacterium]
MLKRIFLYIAAFLCITSCSDDYFNPISGQLPENGELNIDFSVPSIQTVQTRSDFEDNLNDVAALVFESNANTAKLVQKEKLTPSGGKAKMIIKNTTNTSLYFVFVGNHSDSFYNGLTVNTTTLKTVKESTNSVKGSSALIMSGVSDLSSLIGGFPVMMYRNGGKITCNMQGSGGSLGSAVPFTSFGSPSVGSVVAGGFYNSNSSDKSTFLASPQNVNSWTWSQPQGNTDYIVATDNTGKDPCPYIIIQASFGGQSYYYRLDFKQWDETNKKEKNLKVEPNHEYQFVIKSISGPGKNTMKEAAANPTPVATVDYDIHDHAPVVMNMVTDGLHELGVENNVIHTGSAGSEYLIVKVLTKQGTGPAFDASCIKISNEYSAWLEVGNVSEVSEEDNINEGYSGEDDVNDKGTLYKVELKFKGKSLGVQDGALEVSWAGLTRSVPIIWDGSFVATDLFSSVKLYMYKGTGESSQQYPQNGENNEYFTEFLAKQALGISKEANNGSPRDQGFHFPYLYGTGSSDYYHYKYVVNYKDLNDGDPYDWKAEIRSITKFSDGKSLKDYVSISKESGKSSEGHPSFTLNCSGDIDGYATAELVLSVIPSSGDTIKYTTDIYHTGFFHKDDNFTYATDQSNKGKYFYYEVMKDDNNNRWLDRNLGATSAQMYVEDESGSTIYGNSAAAGKYYRIAEYKQYDTPKIQEISCPPGYSVPTKSQMDKLRKSGNFHTESAGDYYNSYFYDSSSGKSVYFPRARYLNSSDGKAGQTRSGYYWTRTAASGLEKDEYGNWLVGLSIIGGATSTMNAAVDNSSSSVYKGTTKGKGFALNVRCMQTKDDDEVSGDDRTYFFVYGVTHVYLYMGEGESRTAVTQWPGIPIGNYSSAGDWFNFTYESNTFTPDNLKVIFNYKDSNGQIHSMSKNTGNTKIARITTSISPSNLEGWKVKGDVAPNWNNYGNSTLTTSLGFYWLFDTVDSKGAISSSKITFKKYYRIYFKYGDVKGLNVWNEGSSIIRGDYEVNANKNNKKGDYFNCNSDYPNYYYLEFDGGEEVEKFYVQQLPNHSNQQTIQATDFEFDGVYYCFTVKSGTATGYSGKPKAEYDTIELLKKWIEENPLTDSDKRRIFWDNSGKNWDTVRIYWWNPEGPKWDNRPTMNKIPGDKYWYYDIPSDAEKFKFSNNYSGNGNESGDHTPTTDRCNIDPDVWNN